MFIDSRTLAPQHNIQADICIIGAGAAGITIANKLSLTGKRIALIESGGLELDAQTQALYEGGNKGLDYFSLDTTRLRFFGGTTNHWGGVSTPLESIDFRQRHWVPYSGWPFPYEEFETYLPEAFEICDLGSYGHPTHEYIAQNARLLTPKPHFGLKTWYFSHPTTRFGKKYHDILNTSRNVSVYLYANLIKIHASESKNHITGITLSTLSHTIFHASAKYYILACGGLENPRLLLVSQLGGKNVGRFFMDHPRVDNICELMLFDDTAADRFYRQKFISGSSMRGAISLTTQAQEESKLLNTAFKINFNIEVEDVTDIAQSIQKFTQKLIPRPYQHTYYLRSRPEQVPNPDSRVTLMDTKDAFGMPRIMLNWQLTEQDLQNMHHASRLLALSVAASGLGRVRLTPADEWAPITGANHHMGTTRMAKSISTGVVDKNCRVFDVDNLYVAGSSVFSTSSWGNPTINLVALSLRLADHLKRSIF